MKAARYLLNSSLLAALGLGDTPMIVCAWRVGHRPPRPCFARRAYRTEQGPFPLPLTGRFSTGAQACTYLSSGGVACPAPLFRRGGALRLRARVRAVVGVPDRSCPADRVRSSSSSYASNNSVSISGTRLPDQYCFTQGIMTRYMTKGKRSR